MVQFLMKLLPEFESIHGSLLNREVTSALDVELAAVLREETRVGTQAAMESMSLLVVALLAQKSTIDTSSRTTKRSVQCYECNDFDHIAVNCLKKKKFCAYCKIIGHHIFRIIVVVLIVHQAYQTDITKSIGSFPSGHDLERLIQDSIVAALSGAISSALSASSGTSNSIKSTWYLNSGASNHIIGDLSQFSSVYDDVSKHVIHTANMHTLPASSISSVGNLSNVLYVPNLKANFVSVGQLVDQNCVVKFSPNDCVVQNLKIGMTMAKGRSVGRMFLLKSIHHDLHHYFLLVSTADVTRSNKLLTLWHNRMGHPHSSRLQHMLKSYLPAIHGIHSSLPLTCSNCAGSKSHKLHFPSSSSSYDDLFDLIHSDV
ncbi:hypothetical protein KY284_012276 [Solanum tuberosum]|nr:hypothetical protein KY284_012276 [Solanum tuberosum]